jgi:hypothetical protein
MRKIWYLLYLQSHERIFIIHPFSLQQFNLEYSLASNKKTPDIKKKHLTFLYEDLYIEDIIVISRYITKLKKATQESSFSFYIILN